jgi:hypothetical protein
LNRLTRRRTLGRVPTRLADLRRLLRVDHQATFPLWLKIAVTLSYVFISHGVWQQYSAFNFLWFSHIGFMGTVLALWLESRLLASMMLLNTFVADGVGWTLDLIVALVSGRHPFGATAYMFDQRIPLLIRCLALFHVVVPALLAWMVYKLGYDRRALIAQTVLAWAVLLFCVSFTNPALNLNCVFGPGTQRQTLIPAWFYFVILMIYVPLAFYLPIHLLLTRLLKWNRPRESLA